MFVIVNNITILYNLDPANVFSFQYRTDDTTINKFRTETERFFITSFI